MLSKSPIGIAIQYDWLQLLGCQILHPTQEVTCHYHSMCMLHFQPFLAQSYISNCLLQITAQNTKDSVLPSR